VALVVPGGVDASGEYRVIPALLAFIERLARRNEVHVYALQQQSEPAEWDLLGARVYNMGADRPRLRAWQAICARHRSSAFDVVHAIFSGASGLVAVTAARWLRVPSLVHIAGGELVALPDIAYGGALTWRGRVREKLVLKGASLISAASAPIVQQLANLGLPAQRVPLGVDLAAWPPRVPSRRSADRPARLVHVASLNRVKDQTTLLQALAGLAREGAGFEVDIVGEDTLNGQMQSLATELGLGGLVRFHGFLPQRQLRPLMESANLLVMSSRHEAGPLVMLEAAVVGVPTVGTAVGHVAEWAPYAAIAVPVGDPAALTEAIAGLLNNESRRLAVAQEAWRRATRENADHTASAFEAMYLRLTTGA
jgi:glycosyltransferase involved in cell wall biosynthesis